jgi:hypothetical protein
MDIKTKARSSSALFSDCKKYRYTLVREFDFKDGMLNFIMLNPSTATEEFNDPTVSRCENITIGLGFKYMAVTNIFAFRATDPADMYKMGIDAIGLNNDSAILDIAKRSKMIICAWGNHGEFLERGNKIRELLQKNKISIHALKLNAGGHPAHPLYLRKDLKPFLI